VQDIGFKYINMDSRITTSSTLVSEIKVVETISAPFASRGLIWQPLRNFDGSLMTDFAGNILYEMTATYQSLITKDSFITTTI